MSGRRGEEIKFTETAPQKEALVALITVLRQIYGQGNSIYFNRVYNIVWKYLEEKDEKVKECAVSAKSVFKQILEKSQLSMKINNKTLKPIELINLWFNANIFHADIDKVKKLEHLLSLPIAPFIVFEFKNAILNLSNVIIYFGSFIEAELLNPE